MKPVFGVAVLAIVGIGLFGTPLPVARPSVDYHWLSRVPILPMTFAHRDHVGQNCLVCHHNYADDTGDAACMFCHVDDERVADLLEPQFHELCMGCHLERQRAGDAHGPVRRCVDCHLEESFP